MSKYIISFGIFILWISLVSGYLYNIQSKILEIRYNFTWTTQNFSWSSVHENFWNKLFTEKDAITFNGRNYNAVSSWVISWLPYTYYIPKGSYTKSWWVLDYIESDLISIDYFSGKIYRERKITSLNDMVEQEWYKIQKQINWMIENPPNEFIWTDIKSHLKILYTDKISENVYERAYNTLSGPFVEAYFFDGENYYRLTHQIDINLWEYLKNYMSANTGSLINRSFWESENYIQKYRGEFWRIFLNNSPELKPETNITKFALQSNSGFCPQSAEWCGDSSLTISEYITIYQNNKEICSSKTQSSVWNQLVRWVIMNVIKSVKIPTLCSSCFDGPEMTLSISTLDGEYNIDFDSAQRFEFNMNNLTHVQLKSVINNINEIWSKNRNGNEGMVCTLRQ